MARQSHFDKLSNLAVSTFLFLLLTINFNVNGFGQIRIAPRPYVPPTVPVIGPVFDPITLSPPIDLTTSLPPIDVSVEPRFSVEPVSVPIHRPAISHHDHEENETGKTPIAVSGAGGGPGPGGDGDGDDGGDDDELEQDDDDEDEDDEEESSANSQKETNEVSWWQAYWSQPWWVIALTIIGAFVVLGIVGSFFDNL